LTACDMPSLQLPFLELLYAKASTSQKMVVPLDFKGNAVFLCSLIPKSYISTILECRLHAKALKALVPLVEILWLTPEEWKEVDPQGLSLKNINTPEEYHDFLNHYQAESTS
jgi:molybdopterin-guanine dinucleotide biosynthesis protein A